MTADAGDSTGLSPDGAEVALEALQQVNAELRLAVEQAFGDIQLASLRSLDAGGMLRALQSVGLQVRKQLLGELGLRGPKALDIGFANLAAQKLRTSDPRVQRWAARRLGIPTWNALAEAGAEISDRWGSDRAATTRATDALADAPPCLLRLALATCWVRDDGFVAPGALLRLLDDDLALDEWRPNLDDVRITCAEAAQRVDELLAELDELLEPSAEDTDEDIIQGDQEVTSEEAPLPRTASSSPGSGAESRLAQLPDVAALVDRVADEYATASAAAARIVASLGEGSPADGADMLAIGAFGDSLEVLREHISLLDETVSAAELTTLDAARDAVLSIAAAADAELAAASDLEGVTTIAELPADHALASLYSAARDRAIELVGVPVTDWSAGDRSDARQLAEIAAANTADQTGRPPDPPTADDFREAFRGALGLAIGCALPSAAPSSDEQKQVTVAHPLSKEPVGAGSGAISGAIADANQSDPEVDEESRDPGRDSAASAVPEEKPRVAETSAKVSVRVDAGVSDSKAGDGTEAAETRQAHVDDEPEAALDEGDILLAQLIRERRFGLGYWVATATDQPPLLIRMLEVLAYADRIRAPAGECAGAFKQALEGVELDELRTSRAAQLLALAAGVPAAIFSPYSGAAQLLRHVGSVFGDHEPLSRFIDAVVAAAERGVQVEADFVRRTRDLASLEAELNGVRERASEMRNPRSLVFARASDVWRHWVDLDGQLGKLLVAVEADDEGRVADVERRVLELRDQRELEHLVDETDRALRRRTARASIEARARQALLKGAKDALDVAAEWVDLVRERAARRRTQASLAWQREPLDHLRSAATDCRIEILELAEAWRSVRNELDASAGAATGAILEDLLLLLGEGKPLAGAEPLAHLVLGEELLKAPEVQLSPVLQPLDGAPPLLSLVRAANTNDWVAAFDARSQAGDHDATKQIIALVAQTDVELAAQLEDRRESALQAERAHVKRLQAGVLRDLDAARRLGHITDEAWGRYFSQLDSLEIETTLRLGAAANVLKSILDALAQHRIDEVERARSSFGHLGLTDTSIVGRVDRLLAVGDVAAYQELVLAVQRGLPVPEPEPAPELIEEFFPAVIDALSRQVPHSDELLAAAEKGTRVGPLDFSGVAPERREDVVSALNAWVELLANDRTNQQEKLRRIMWVLGFDAEDINLEEPVKRRGGGRGTTLRSGDLRARPVGRALVPAFGSGAEGKYRLLLAYERMTEDALLDRVAQEPGAAPIIVLNFGSMSVQVRRGLIDQVRRQRRRPVCVVDTTTFLFVSAQGGGLETLMRVALPFTAVNPYTPFVAGKVPREMFYGRKHELESVIDPNGTSFIYGGRRLGKSALLRAAEREFSDTAAEHHAIYIDLKNHGIGEWRPASDIHDVLAREFADRRMITSRARKGSPDDLYEELGAWIEAGEDRKVLLLLDEADEFLNADATEGFRIVRRLKELMDRTERRFKPVLAGLHQVQRFQSIPNQPLSHLGQPIAVGPLSPQYAFNLVVTPLHALGYRFVSDEIVFRVLTNTNYQPSLIQLFCDELVTHMLRRPVPSDAPPYAITMDDVENVYGSPDLANETRNRFEQTINLDPRYRVIAYVLALKGLDAHLSASIIREECEEWWPAGFEDTTDDEFRALLDELKGLGILYSEGGRYTMRSPNVLRMLGTHDQIEDRLLGASEANPPQKFQAATFRAPVANDPYRRSPLTEQQTAALIKAESDVRIVLGSSATGIEGIPAALSSAADRASSRVEVLTVAPDRGRLKRALAKEVQGRHRLVVSELSAASQQEAEELIALAVELVSQHRESTRSVAFVADVQYIGLWRAVLGAGNGNDHISGVDAVVLRRWSRAGLRAWSHSQDVDLPFADDEAIDRVQAATGGWPFLVDMFVQRYLHDHRFDNALDAVNASFESSASCAAFISDSGLTNDQQLLQAWKQLVEYGEPVEREDVLALLEVGDQPGTAVELLRALQALEISADGRISPEPTLLRAWSNTGAGETVI